VTIATLANELEHELHDLFERSAHLALDDEGDRGALFDAVRGLITTALTTKLAASVKAELDDIRAGLAVAQAALHAYEGKRKYVEAELDVISGQVNHLASLAAWDKANAARSESTALMAISRARAALK
jgi:hypothetical protein